MSGENVGKLERHAPKSADDAALGFSLQIDLGAGRVATLPTFLPNNCTGAELNAMLDKMTAAGDRQRAHYKIEELVRDLEKSRKDRGLLSDDLERAEAHYAVEQEARAKLVEDGERNVAEFAHQVQERNASAGRRDIAPKGADKANLSRVLKGVADAKVQIEQATTERDKVRADSKIALERWDEIIAKNEAELARCRAVVAAGLQD